MDTPCPLPKVQLVTRVSDVGAPLLLVPRAMLSSPTLILQSCTRQFVPTRSIPSVLCDCNKVGTPVEGGALSVMPRIVMLPPLPLNTMFCFGAFERVTF